jgi:hypothetical protein
MIKAHRSRNAVQPDLETAALAGFLLNGVRWLSPDASDFLGHHAKARLCRHGGCFLWALGSVWHPAHRLKLAGKILIEILSIFSHALEDFREGQRRDKQYREENAYGFKHGQLSSLYP